MLGTESEQWLSLGLNQEHLCSTKLWEERDVRQERRGYSDSRSTPWLTGLLPNNQNIHQLGQVGQWAQE